MAVSSYAILGCGSVGHAVADALVANGKDVTIFDRDENRVEALRDQDLDAHVGDIREQDVIDRVASSEAVLVFSSDPEANEAAVERLAATDTFVVARADDPVSVDALRDLGADVVINPASVIAESTIRTLEAGELEHRAQQLAGTLESVDRLAILTHDDPDPDAIASAVALRTIALHLDTEADVVTGGDIGHQENRAFVNLLGIDLIDRDASATLDDYDGIALVDYAHGETGDVPDRRIDVVIDREETEASGAARFADVRPDLSATSTILTKYLQEFDLTPDETVATALLYGIRAETVDFKRGTTPADLTAAAYLYPFVDHETLEQVESPSMSPETLDVLAEAISNRQVEGSHLVSNAGFITDREALAQAAQHLLNLEGVTTAAVFGIVEDRIYLTARSKDIRMDIGNVLGEAFGEGAEPVGHATQATAEIPLGIFTGLEQGEENRDQLVSLVEEAVTRKLFEALGVESEGGNGS